MRLLGYEFEFENVEILMRKVVINPRKGSRAYITSIDVFAIV